MELVDVDIKLPNDFEAFARAEVQSGRYAYVDEVVLHGFYLLIQDQDSKGLGTPESKMLLSRTLEQTLAEFRQAMDKKFARSST
jgi:Arc/MetJ-type ribon-helix-helix transcriptional regulator